MDVETIDLRDNTKWRTLAEPNWEQAASWHVTRWVLGIFTLVYVLCFAIGAVGLAKDGGFTEAMELVRFMLTTIMPLVTLAVGYYLGSRNSDPST